MLYIVCVRDCRDFAFDDVAGRFSDDEWHKARSMLDRLNRLYGRCP